MLLTTTPSYTNATAKKNAGTVVLGGNVPSNDRVTQYPSFIVTAQSGLLGNGMVINTISAAAGSGLYLGSGINGGTLASDDRNDAIMYYNQKTDLAGVAVAGVGQPVAGPVLEPSQIVSGSFVSYPSGWNLSGQLLAPAAVGGESYNINASTDRAATGTGRWTYTLGGLPTSGANPAHV